MSERGGLGDSFFHFQSWLKRYYGPFRYWNYLAGFGISSDFAPAFFEVKNPEITYLYPLAVFQGFKNGIEDFMHYFFYQNLFDSGFSAYFKDNISLGHNYNKCTTVALKCQG